MNPAVELHLSLILFLPWFAVLGALYWLFPRAPRHRARRLFDAAMLLLALALSVWAMRLGYLHADQATSKIWKQVLATLAAYGAFLGVLCAALALRHRLWRGNVS